MYIQNNIPCLMYLRVCLSLFLPSLSPVLSALLLQAISRRVSPYGSDPTQGSFLPLVLPRKPESGFLAPLIITPYK